MSGVDAARLLASRFAPPFVLSAKTARRLPDLLARLGIAGSAVCDTLVALAALDKDAELATRGARARDTYERVGVCVVAVAPSAELLGAHRRRNSHREIVSKCPPVRLSGGLPARSDSNGFAKVSRDEHREPLSKPAGGP